MNGVFVCMFALLSVVGVALTLLCPIVPLKLAFGVVTIGCVFMTAYICASSE